MQGAIKNDKNRKVTEPVRVMKLMTVFLYFVEEMNTVGRLHKI